MISDLSDISFDQVALAAKAVTLFEAVLFRYQVVSLVRNALPSKSATSSTFPQFRWQVVFLHHFCLSKHSLSQETRLTERRVLACNRLVLAHFGFADLRTAHPFFDPFGTPRPPFRPLFL